MIKVMIGLHGEKMLQNVVKIFYDHYVSIKQSQDHLQQNKSNKYLDVRLSVGVSN